MDEKNVKKEAVMAQQDAVPLTNAGSFAESFSGIPIETLICEPLIAASKGQQTLEFHMVRPVNADDKTAAKEVTIKAPLISLTPIPALKMDEVSVDFDMEVKVSHTERDEAKTDVSLTEYINLGNAVHATITGKVSSDGKHKRKSGSTDSFKIHERAAGQSHSEELEKLTSLLEKGKNLG